ncbi:hypothetical protein GJAV_G00095000 [Gymnothorax javanicus]|nr:hypothetical protein GJAV_G00095000 [Gymnothorax javanicus]
MQRTQPHCFPHPNSVSASAAQHESRALERQGTFGGNPSQCKFLQYHEPWWYQGTWIKIFGSGTNLIVTETGQRKPPTLIAFPPSNPQDGKTTLLCIAKGMFPDVVNFKWKEEDEEVSVAEKRIMEQKIDDGRASMLIIEETTVEKSHSCIVVYEGNPEGSKKLIPKSSTEGEGSSPDKRMTCNYTVSDQTLPGFELSRSLYLSSLTYTFMILKSAAYFGFASLILCKRSRK